MFQSVKQDGGQLWSTYRPCRVIETEVTKPKVSSHLACTPITPDLGGCEVHIEYSKNGGMSFSRFSYKTVWLFPCWNSPTVSLAHFAKASCHAVNCTTERPTWHGTESGLSGSQWYTEALSSTAHKELNPANTHWMSLEANPQAHLE